MAKRCTVCNDEAEFRIKNSSDFYCRDCAEENFSDITLLIQLEEEAQKLKHVINEKLAPQEIEDESN